MPPELQGTESTDRSALREVPREMEKAGDRTETRDRATEIEGQRVPEIGEHRLDEKERLEQHA